MQTKTEKAYTFHADPGHAWLAVPIADLRALGVERSISPYSYVNCINIVGCMVYLEEDLDAGTFITAAKLAGWVLDISHQQGGGFIRDLDQFPAADGWRERAYA